MLQTPVPYITDLPPRKRYQYLCVGLFGIVGPHDQPVVHQMCYCFRLKIKDYIHTYIHTRHLPCTCRPRSRYRHCLTEGLQPSNICFDVYSSRKSLCRANCCIAPSYGGGRHHSTGWGLAKQTARCEPPHGVAVHVL